MFMTHGVSKKASGIDGDLRVTVSEHRGSQTHDISIMYSFKYKLAVLFKY